MNFDTCENITATKILTISVILSRLPSALFGPLPLQILHYP